ncbi:MAG: DUF58 domain-containing protein [Bacteroidota bacterium]|uniref:DUF58 domain-containing protein n=1 Tax=Algoriphagus faecimaris TaxID=686796 RepID=A0A1G6TUA5_9BACT|nr:DUF58 domain-containing protein [Algoriphagus faecimaris]SDD32673.1 Protein of unknown function DUF58 [Algoriphagus faecimaris]
MPSNLEIIKLRDLRLAARLISEQLRQGVHSGIRVGVGSEFEQYRHYNPGDDPKRIDWKYFSRSGKYMVKESTTETNLNVSLILDLSGSMNYEEDGFSRLDYAKNLLASLSYLGFLQGDALSFFTLKEGEFQRKVAPSPKSFQRILYELDQAVAGGSWPLDKAMPKIGLDRNRELIIWVSDFLQKNEEWENLVKNFSHPRKELVLVQLLGAQELDFQLEGNLIFRDLESGQELVQDGKTAQKTFRANFKSYLDHLASSFQLPQVQLISVSMEEHLAEVVRLILNRKRIA